MVVLLRLILSALLWLLTVGLLWGYTWPNATLAGTSAWHLWQRQIVGLKVLTLDVF